MTPSEVRDVDVARTTGPVIEETVATVRPKDLLDRFIEVCERFMPDLAMLGAILSLLVFYLAATGSDFGASEDAAALLRESAEAASASPGYVPF